MEDEGLPSQDMGIFWLPPLCARCFLPGQSLKDVQAMAHQLVGRLLCWLGFCCTSLCGDTLTYFRDRIGPLMRRVFLEADHHSSLILVICVDRRLPGHLIDATLCCSTAKEHILLLWIHLMDIVPLPGFWEIFSPKVGAYFVSRPG